MRKFAYAAVLAASSAIAQPTPHAELIQKLVDAQRDGIDFVAATFYPEVNPPLAKRDSRLRKPSNCEAAADRLDVENLPRATVF
jgi:hypothetical protein